MTSGIDRSRLRRAVSLSKLGAKLALKQGRRLVARDESEVHREVARLLVKELGALKGLPMKVGQLLSYMNGAVPDEYREVYQSILGELRTTSTPVAPGAWRGVFAEELGEQPEAMLEEFDPTPMATASIGQVHRAVHHGQPVCVKIQYPGIAEAIRSDLANVEALVAVLRRVMPRVDTRQMIDDFRVRLAEECDYEQEADYQRRFAAIYRDDPDIVVPAVVGELSTKRVLTTRFVTGLSLADFVASASRTERDRAGLALFRFAFGTLIEHGLFHADPHPGNLLFRADGGSRVAVLDYGCVQPIDGAARRDIAELLRAAIEHRDLEGPMRAALGITSMDRATRDAAVAIVERVLQPIVAPQPYRFTPEFATDISRSVIDAKAKLAARYVTRRGELVAERPGVMFIVRNLFGLATIWGELEAEGDFRALALAMIDATRDPRSDGRPSRLAP
jgi:predicted unusual protein kinase regulating ubiquinone biosynthesis (AarF/ABC1/UbiB family)